jgi:hypothetical protein
VDAVERLHRANDPCISKHWDVIRMDNLGMFNPEALFWLGNPTLPNRSVDVRHTPVCSVTDSVDSDIPASFYCLSNGSL